jgi:hypothetical protein
MDAIASLRLPPDESRAAEPPDGYDLPLPPRRRYQHVFVGVDYALDPDVPFAGERARNALIRERQLARVRALLRVAAALRIDAASPGEVTVEVANLATGHPLPAGFAFAREIWLEVSVRPAGSTSWLVIGGGRDGRELRPDEDLPAGVHDFQAVLWNGHDAADDAHGNGETVLQSEVRGVLTGASAREHGFLDREEPLEPIPPDGAPAVLPRVYHLPIEADARPGDTVRVRLLHRNLPPKFLMRLAARLRSAGRPAEAEGCAALVGALRIESMAEDEETIR